MAKNHDLGRGPPKITSSGKFGDGRFKHLDLGTTSANTCLSTPYIKLWTNTCQFAYRNYSAAAAILLPLKGSWLFGSLFSDLNLDT